LTSIKNILVDIAYLHAILANRLTDVDWMVNTSPITFNYFLPQQ